MSAVTIRVPGLICVEHTFTVPLDHARPEGSQLEVFAREVAAPGGTDRPLLVYLQGGPGFEAVRPTGRPLGPGWLERALADYRVLLVDQRGTGRSTPVGTLPGMDGERQAAYLAHFRADAIVADCEHIRRALGVARWSVIGQSFGGMCVVAYLSAAPDALREAFVCGGLPPLGNRIDEVYTRTWALVAQRNHAFRETFSQDRARLERLRALVEGGGVPLAGGRPLTWRRVRQLGQLLGFSDGAERLHHLLELPFDSPALRHDVTAVVEFERNPLYAVLHEACWADGGVTGWSAQRTMPAAFDADPELLFGEHVFDWMFEDYPALAPLREAAQRLATREWPRLYDPAVLTANEVPCAAAIYAHDMYVERAFSEETAAAIRGLRPWLTSEYEHNGLRADGGRVLGHLIDLVRGRA